MAFEIGLVPFETGLPIGQLLLAGLHFRPAFLQLHGHLTGLQQQLGGIEEFRRWPRSLGRFGWGVGIRSGMRSVDPDIRTAYHQSGDRFGGRSRTLHQMRCRRGSRFRAIIHGGNPFPVAASADAAEHPVLLSQAAPVLEAARRKNCCYM